MATLTVQVKVPGQRREAPEWEIPLPLSDSGDHQLLRDLITRIVIDEVTAFHDRQEERRLTRILSPDDIERGAATGKIDSGGRDPGPDVDPHRSVATALQAFEDGLYYVFVNGDQQNDLDREVLISSSSRITFLRLTPLAGG